MQEEFQLIGTSSSISLRVLNTIIAMMFSAARTVGTLVGCISSNWRDSDTYTTPVIENWDRSALQGAGNEIGMLLDLDEGTLTGYKNGRKLGVKNGLAGEYCWVVSLYNGTQVTIKRGTIPRG